MCLNARFLVIFSRVSLLIMKFFRSHYTDLTCDFYAKDLKNLLSQSDWQSVDRGTLIHVLSSSVKKCSTRLFKLSRIQFSNVDISKMLKLLTQQFILAVP